MKKPSEMDRKETRGMDDEKIKMSVKYILISLFILIAAVLIGLFVDSVFFQSADGDIANRVSGMLDGIIGAIGIGLVLLQLKDASNDKKHQNSIERHQNDIEEADFLLKLNQAFIQDNNMYEVEHLLEKQAYYDESIEIINEKNRQLFVNYLAYLESLAPLILNGVISLNIIDNLMSYRYFIAVDNREVQDKELCRFPEYYRGCFQIYNMWKGYRSKMGYRTPIEDPNVKNGVLRALSSVEEPDVEGFSFEKYSKK